MLSINTLQMQVPQKQVGFFVDLKIRGTSLRAMEVTSTWSDDRAWGTHRLWHWLVGFPLLPMGETFCPIRQRQGIWCFLHSWWALVASHWVWECSTCQYAGTFTQYIVGACSRTIGLLFPKSSWLGKRHGNYYQQTSYETSFYVNDPVSTID